MSVFEGAWPALITPATADGDVNLAVLRELTEFLIGRGSAGLYVCGATGEGLLMSVAERVQVTETVLEQVKGRVPAIIHVGATATRDAVALARHAAQAGAAGISSVLPSQGSGLASTYLHYGAIAAAAPGLPFFPYLYGGQTDAYSLMVQLLPRIPNIGGAKYTGPNMFELRQLIELGQDHAGWTIFSGMDEQCLYGAMSGAPGNIGSTLNLMPGVYRELRCRHAAGDLVGAAEMQTLANRVTGAMISFGFTGALRVAMRSIGFDCGRPRLPLLPLPEERHEELIARLAEAGLAQTLSI